jgi:hypothetical protein
VFCTTAQQRFRITVAVVAATHDAAGLAIAGRAFVAGGGTAASVPAVQVFPLGVDVLAGRAGGGGGAGVYLIGLDRYPDSGGCNDPVSR